MVERIAYIGVTGFMSREEVEKALEAAPKESSHMLMVGVLASSKTLAGAGNNWPDRYPKVEDIEHIFVTDGRAFNLIHYSTDDRSTLLGQLLQLTELGGPWLDGFQLNIAWPEPVVLKEYLEKYPDKFLILQVGKRAMEQVASLVEFRERIESYLPHIDGVLIDPSGGLGKPLDATIYGEHLRAIWDYPIGIGIAGGLGPDTLSLLQPLVPEFFPELSIDAEGQLRTPQPEDKLDIDKVRKYLTEAYPILSDMPS